MLHIRLDTRVSELATDQTLGIKDGVGSVHGSLGLCGITDKTLGFSEGAVTWSGTITLIVGNDLDTIILPDTNTGIGGSKINSDGFSANS